MATIDASALVRLRRARGLSQRALADSAGITRQAVGAIESGRMQPGVGIALALARALDTSVEELFGGEREPTPIPARVATGTIGGRAVRHPLDAEHLAIESAEGYATNVFVAGCDLAVGLLSRHAFARSRDARVLWLPMTNRAALDALARKTVHAAVVHADSAREKRLCAGKFARFELATTEAGWLAARGNPLALRGVADVVRTKARVVNRPAGAGARQLLDQQLRRAALDPHRVIGYSHELAGQIDAGRAVAQGFADAAVGLASVAHLFNLSFVPLREERCTLLVPYAALGTTEIRTLLDTLRSNSYRRELQALETYDVRRTGEELI
jgi:molybdate-binding protein/transcriptional regulator with XRE-family HTH domain